MISTTGARVRVACITVLGSGFIRPANATWGSLLSCLLFSILFAAVRALGLPRFTLDAIALAAIGAACVAAVAWGEWAIVRFGSKDPRPFVLDEFAGQWIALLILPDLAWGDPWTFGYLLLGQFILFRIFDVTKLPPARQLERLPAGWGILCDDLMAGIYTNLAGRFLWLYTPLAHYLGLTG